MASPLGRQTDYGDDDGVLLY